jgi:hypothetical protein
VSASLGDPAINRWGGASSPLSVAASEEGAPSLLSALLLGGDRSPGMSSSGSVPLSEGDRNPGMSPWFGYDAAQSRRCRPAGASKVVVPSMVMAVRCEAGGRARSARRRVVSAVRSRIVVVVAVADSLDAVVCRYSRRLNSV